jgi:hypothetical protein
MNWQQHGGYPALRLRSGQMRLQFFGSYTKDEGRTFGHGSELVS